MNIWGIGRGLIFGGIFYLIAAILISQHYPDIFIISFIPEILFQVPGILLLIAGIPFWTLAVITLKREFGKGELMTKGVFSFSRNPVYASFILFLIPGVALVSRSWLAMTTPFLMALVFFIRVKKEEAFLEETFGEEYLDYKNKVHPLLSFKKYKKG